MWNRPLRHSATAWSNWKKSRWWHHKWSIFNCTKNYKKCIHRC
jgi:hypothetical protein